MRRSTLPALLILVAGVCNRPCDAQQSARVSGTVRDTAGHPVPGVVVSVVGTTMNAVTGPVGSFRLTDVPVGRRVIHFQRLGFRPAEVKVQVDPAKEALIETTLIAVPAELGPVNVQAEGRKLNLGLEGFEARRKSGLGQFVTREEFDVYTPRDVETVLRRMHSLRVAITKDGPLVLSTRGLVARNGQPAVCAMQIGLDGKIMQADFSIADVNIDEVEAIEVYSGPATIPAEFNTELSGGVPATSIPGIVGGRSFSPETNTYCGLVMIWTRH